MATRDPLSIQRLLLLFVCALPSLGGCTVPTEDPAWGVVSPLEGSDDGVIPAEDVPRPPDEESVEPVALRGGADGHAPAGGDGPAEGDAAAERDSPAGGESTPEGAPLPATVSAPDPERVRSILLRSAHHSMLTWWPERGLDRMAGRWIPLAAGGEHDVRPVAAVAMGLAVLLWTGDYDEAVVGIPEAEARARALQLVESLAVSHRVNRRDGRGWGDEWQSALWASYAGLAGWLLWDGLVPVARERVRRMVAFEADRFLGHEPPYYRNRSGEVVIPGDSKAEESSWNSRVLQLATAMMPDHPRWNGWMLSGLRLMIGAYARPSDVESGEVLHGQPVCHWIAGSNVEDDGLVVNHRRIHPDYMRTPHNASAVLHYTLALKPTPRGALRNLDLLYRALVDRSFDAPPYAAPGGTIYRPGSGDIYYPEGSDWGSRSRIQFLFQDVQARILGLDAGASTPAEEWERLHGEQVVRMMDRFTDGRVYGDWDEFRSPQREEAAFDQAAQAHLTSWIASSGAIRVTNAPYAGLLPPEAADAGCDLPPISGLHYCPADSITRAQAAVLLVRAKHGPDYALPAAAGLFSDVPADHPFAPHIEQLARDGITEGCAAGLFCPGDPLTRAQAATLLVRFVHGPSFDPRPPTGVFTDVPLDHPHAAWIEQLYWDGITDGCRAGAFCPGDLVTRAQAATFLGRARHSPGYQPPEAIGVFSDVPLDHPHARWIEQIWRDRITRGCGR